MPFITKKELIDPESDEVFKTYALYAAVKEIEETKEVYKYTFAVEDNSEHYLYVVSVPNRHLLGVAYQNYMITWMALFSPESMDDQVEECFTSADKLLFTGVL